jgi:bifunctional NMN adenylyltransferase/nudix hydrolase
MKEFGVYIGRFQPFNNAHLLAVRFALSEAKNLIIVLGSDSQARTIKNPWSTPERVNMIRDCLTPDENARIEFVFAKDYLYTENLWITAVQEKVNALTGGSKDVVLIGHKKQTSLYLNQFPQWTFLETGPLADGITGTHIRNQYFSCDLVDIKRSVPGAVFDAMKRDMMKSPTETRPEFLELQKEFEHIEDYKEMWAKSPFPPTFVTVDGVLIKSGHILVVRRKGYPGKGLIALPGGFVNANEAIVDACLREIKEETVIKLSKEDMLTSLRDQHVFDHPDRSLRGRTITHAFCFDLGHGPLPKVKGEDDAAKAWFMPLRDVHASEEKFFEDHFHIITYFAQRF